MLLAEGLHLIQLHEQVVATVVWHRHEVNCPQSVYGFFLIGQITEAQFVQSQQSRQLDESQHVYVKAQHVAQEVSAIFEEEKLFFQQQTFIADRLDVLLCAERVDEVFLELGHFAAGEVNLGVAAHSPDEHDDLGLRDECAVRGALALALLRDAFKDELEEGAVLHISRDDVCGRFLEEEGHE